MGRIPLLGSGLRWLARRYPEGSVVTIKNGHLAGYRWKRSHRYVNGYWLGIYELPVQKCLARELRPGHVFYDIGANAGFFSLLGSKCVGEKGHVFAFEPLPENIETIKNQLELNQITNCTLVEAAVSGGVGEIKLYTEKNTHTATVKPRVSTRKSVRMVRCITLDEFVKTALPPDFIKMDIEGAEIMALRGSAGILQSERPPKLLIEFHNESLKEQGQSLLGKHKYRLFALNGKMIESRAFPHYVLAAPPSRMVAKQRIR